MDPTPDTPRPEHPKPQFQRESWLNLNGRWTFEFDPGRSGLERGLPNSSGFERGILVPFCPESPLSGVGHRDFIECLWYHRRLAVPAEWAGRRILLHFGAVDFESEVFLDGRRVGAHYGGTCSFHHDITAFVKPGSEHHLVVRVLDDLRSGLQPGGKQCPSYASRGCLYTRTTGIWQTVWIEAVHENGLASAHIVPDLDGARFVVTPRFLGLRRGLAFCATLLDEGAVVAQARTPAADGVPVAIPVERPKRWSPGRPHLYDLRFEVLGPDGVPLDLVRSYAGLRKFHVEGDRLFLNNEEVFLRLVLDQGFYPDGVWTAPSDEALRRDIALAQRAGFHGARLHQKVFEERYHYWADRMGFLTWGESASWGVQCWRAAAESRAGALNFLTEWRDIVCRDRNHPSIIAWSPFNETSGAEDWAFHRRVHREAYALTRSLDPTRPVNDSSGYVHQQTDLWTAHKYEQDPLKLREVLTPKAPGDVWRNAPEQEAPYQGQPYLVDEFGGIKWAPGEQQVSDRSISWGYGAAPATEEEFYARLEGLVDALLALPHVRGYCYTQLTDVEQEKNGVYFYDRQDKFDMARVARIFRKTPA